MTTDMFNLNNETAVVIGGTGVLGGAMAEALAVAGAKVAVVGRSAERGNQRVQSIESGGGTAMFWVSNTSSDPTNPSWPLIPLHPRLDKMFRGWASASTSPWASNLRFNSRISFPAPRSIEKHHS